MQTFFLTELESMYERNELNIIWQALHEAFIPENEKNTDRISESQILKFLYGIKNLKRGMPYQYVCGFADFYYLRIGVNSHTLIPRPETEELVEWILKNEKETSINLHVKDVCTGSGCIALALKNKRKSWTISGSDLYTKTLEKAQENAKELKLDVSFFEENALQINTEQKELYDIIVSNPPYISEEEKANMHENVLSYEPHAALFGGADDTLKFYRSIAQQGNISLKKGGRIYFELNQYLVFEIRDILAKLGYEEIIIQKDISGNNRMLRAVRA